MSNLFKYQLIKVYESISYHGIDEASNNRDKDFYVILNQYLFMLFTIFMVQGIFSFYFLGIQRDAVFLWLSSSASLIFGFFFKKYCWNRFFVSTVFILLIVIVSYYSSVNGVESGCFLYYFPILSAIPIFFNLRGDKVFVIVIVSSIITSLYISAYYNFQLWGPTAQVHILEFKHEFLMINITCNLLFLGVNYFFLEEKRNDYYAVLSRNIYKKALIKDLNDENRNLKNSIDKEELSDENLKELLASAILSELLFCEKFEKFFPLFAKNIFNDTSVSLSLSEFTLSAMLKLGLSTKEIASHTNSSVKAIEGRKYRLRKKLYIQSDVDLIRWFSKF